VPVRRTVRGAGPFCAAVLLAVARPAGSETIPAYVAAAVDDPGRLDTDREHDSEQRPAEVLAFAGAKPGDKVANFMPGEGYFTKLLCKVVGDTGHVYAVSVPRAAAPATSGPEVAAPDAPDAAAAVRPGEPCTNVTVISLQPRMRPAPELHSDSGDPGWVYEYWTSVPAAENFVSPEPLDLIWSAEHYHDLRDKAFGSPDLLAVDKALLAALRPGGILVIEDQAAGAGPGVRHRETQRRKAAAKVKQEVIEAGFAFVAESGQAERFLLRFRKP
jgi:predicted methyltransferase